jgi:hypothetical protein
MPHAPVFNTRETKRTKNLSIIFLKFLELLFLIYKFTIITCEYRTSEKCISVIYKREYKLGVDILQFSCP